MLEILSAFAELEVSGCDVSLGASEVLAGLDELLGVISTAGSGDNAGCEGLRCGMAAGDFPPLLVGRVGKTGGRVTVLGRIGLLPDAFGGCLLPGCTLRDGVSDFDGCKGAMGLWGRPHTLQK